MPEQTGGLHYYGVVPDSVPAPLQIEHPVRSAFVLQFTMAV